MKSQENGGTLHAQAGHLNAGIRNNCVLWKRKCDCGNICEERANSLRSGHVESCGCIKVEQYRANVIK